MEELVSIIIPLYNRKHLIRRCVDSVCCQTYKNLEIIVVDDGSTDEPDAVLAELAQDTRVKIIRKPNGGVSSARNAGLDAATGTYVQFVDSDDIIVETATTLAVSAMKRHKVDCVTFAHAAYVPGQMIEVPQETVGCKLCGTEKLISTFKAWRQCAVWNKLYKRDLLDGLRFNEKVSWGEDYIFAIEYLEKCEDVVALDAVLAYISSDTPESLNKRYNPDGFRDAEAQYDASRELLKRNESPEIFELLQRYLWGCYLQCVLKLCNRSGLPYTERVRVLRFWSKSDFVGWLKAGFAPSSLVCRCLRRRMFCILPAVVYGCNLKTRCAAMLRRFRNKTR